MKHYFRGSRCDLLSRNVSVDATKSQAAAAAFKERPVKDADLRINIVAPVPGTKYSIFVDLAVERTKGS